MGNDISANRHAVVTSAVGLAAAAASLAAAGTARRLLGARLRAAVDWRVAEEVQRRFAREEVQRLFERPVVRESIAANLRRPIVRRAVLDAFTTKEGTQLITDAAARRDFEFTLELVLGRRVAAVNRTLNRARYERLRDEIAALTGADSVEFALQQALRTLLDAESRGLGRVAGSTYNILGKLVTTPLLSAGMPGPAMEIGTLYGVFAPALMRSFRRVGDMRHLTVVDPFAGLQLQGGAPLPRDPTRAPVSQEGAMWNFRELGLHEDDVRVIPGYSTDEDVRAAAADRQYAVAVIDGDHFAEGVAKDLRWIETTMAPGGIVVMDDFGDPRWPGVEQATRAYLADGGRLELLGTVSTSAYLRMPLG